jgi:peptide/nickel transport system substrate-binding protein
MQVRLIKSTTNNLYKLSVQISAGLRIAIRVPSRRLGMVGCKRVPSQVWRVTTLLSLAFMAVACGTGEAPEPTVAPVAELTPVSDASETSQSTPTPQAAAPPADVEVNPGKVAIMVGDMGNEQFDQIFGVGSGVKNFQRVVHGYLISDNEKREMVPGIAREWGLSADGLTWTFTVRKGVKWHDGSELTPEDVLWTLQHYFGPQAREYLSVDIARMATETSRIELSEPDTVALTSETPIVALATYLSEAGSSIFPVMPKRSKLGNEEESLAYNNNPIGAGSMKLVTHVPAYSMTFDRFDDFYYQPENGFPEDKRVKFQTMDMFMVPEESTRVAAIRSGEADISPISLSAQEQVKAGGGRVLFGEEGVFVNVKLLGCYDPQFPCHDKRVRQALDYAIDKELMRDRLWGPEVFQIKGWNVVTPSTIGYSPELNPRPFDPDKARQLLADAGYPGGQGFGKLIINTFPATSLPLQVEGAQLGAEFWRRELGLDVEVNAGDEVGIRDLERAEKLNGQVMWRDNEARIDAASSIVGNYGDPESYQRSHDNPEIYRLVQETDAVLDPDKRAEAYSKLYDRLREETYTINIGYLNIPWAVGPRILTWQPFPVETHISGLHTITLK